MKKVYKDCLVSLCLAAVGAYLINDTKVFFGVFMMIWADNAARGSK